MNTQAVQKTALVVDDSKSARYAMRKLLEPHGYAVDTAESAEDAYVYLEHRQPDVIFLDHQMQGRDGLDTLRELKLDAHTRSIPVFICSADDDAEFRARARAAGAADVLSKPPQVQRVDEFLVAHGLALPPTPVRRRGRLLSRHAPRVAPSPLPAAAVAPPPAPPPAAPMPAPAASRGEPGFAGEIARRLAALEAEVAALQRKCAALEAAGHPDALLPLLQGRLQPEMDARSAQTARQALSELLEGLARELRDDDDEAPPAVPGA
ncbi:MAG TPA: response regulator [Nevskiaceae bacterium]